MGKMNNQKYREFSLDLEIEKTETLDDGTATFEGFFIVYNTPAPCKPFDFFEQIAPEAVISSLDNDIRCLFNHDTGQVLGRTKNGTLRLENTPDGLYGVCTVNLNDSNARDIYERVKRGDISGCSFGAWIKEQEIDEERGMITITDLDLVEVSVCPFPFYPSTTMEARSQDYSEIQKKIDDRKNMDELKLKFIRKKGELHGLKTNGNPRGN